MNKTETLLRDLLSLIKAHEVTCFSCDRDGETYCDCLDKLVKSTEDELATNDRKA